MSDEEESLLTEDKDHKRIREELRHMSFEDLQKLKERLGTKIYNETMFGKKNEKRQKRDFKRESKSAPAEMSAKRPVSILKKVVPVKKVKFRDPRFDSLSGTFDNKSFKSSYAFLSEYKRNDLENLRKELEVTTDPKTIKKIKYLIQRFENQLREEKRQNQKEEDKHKEKEKLLEAIKRGEKPIYKKKSEKKILNLVSQYEELKTMGRLKKHIQRLRKKNRHKERMKDKNEME